MGNYVQKQKDKYIRLYHNELCKTKLGWNLVELLSNLCLKCQYYLKYKTIINLKPHFQKQASMYENKLTNVSNCTIMFCIRKNWAVTWWNFLVICICLLLLKILKKYKFELTSYLKRRLNVKRFRLLDFSDWSIGSKVLEHLVIVVWRQEISSMLTEVWCIHMNPLGRNSCSSINIHFFGVFYVFLHFNLSFTVVPLKLVSGLGKLICGHFKNRHWAFTGWALASFDTLKFQKWIFPNPMTTFNGTTAKLRPKAKKHRNPNLRWILGKLGLIS